MWYNVLSKASINQLNLPHGTKTKPDMLKNGEQPESVVSVRERVRTYGGKKVVSKLMVHRQDGTPAWWYTGKNGLGQWYSDMNGLAAVCAICTCRCIVMPQGGNGEWTGRQRRSQGGERTGGNGEQIGRYCGKLAATGRGDNGEQTRLQRWGIIVAKRWR